MRDRIQENKILMSNQSQIKQEPLQIDFSRLKLNSKDFEDVTLNLGSLKKVNREYGDKKFVLDAINRCNLVEMRKISDFYFRTSGIYNRMLRYLAFMYRYDWFVTPYVLDEDNVNPTKALTDFYKCLKVLEDFNVKKNLGEIALKVLRWGAYYGYIVESEKGVVLQELPVNYCRSRYEVNGKSLIEFNMKFFTENFPNTESINNVLKIFPPEFQKGYKLYKEHKLPPTEPGDSEGWYPLDITKTVKFNSNGEDYPMLIPVVPYIIDLDEAQDLDIQKTAQRLIKLIIQKMPLDKNGEMIFDEEECATLHQNAVGMTKGLTGAKVLTTFADVEVASLSESNVANTQSDDLDRRTRQLFDASGMSNNLFNTDGNIALEKSQLNDEAAMYNLLLQFEDFLNDLIYKFNKSPKKVSYKVQILTTTIYNYKEMAKLYKEQMQLGFSKMLPQIALGQSQSGILANAYFENDILDLVNLFIPPLMSSTMNADILNRKNGNNNNNADGGAGRPEKPDDQKSLKTIQNKESQS